MHKNILDSAIVAQILTDGEKEDDTHILCVNCRNGAGKFAAQFFAGMENSMIIYKQNILKLLKAKGYNQTILQGKHIFGSNTLQLLRAGKMVSLTVLDRVCMLCHCDISDLIQYEDDEFLNDYTKQDMKKF